jgi:hypothetical protein
MSVSSLVSQIKDTRIIAVDPASHSLAWCILDISKNSIQLVASGKIMFNKAPEMSNKFDIIKNEMPKICDEYRPTHAVIEQSVYIQNFQASRILSYIIGFTWGELDDFCETVQDVNPLKWKSGIGYKNVNKVEIETIKKEYGEKGIQKRLVDERKNRVKKILIKYFKNLDIDNLDSDISDAIGIGLWYALSNGNGALQR